MSSARYKVAGYVKLAKLWEKKSAEAIQYHKEYYRDKFSDYPDAELIDVYIDITGKKEIWKRKSMIRLIHDCQKGRINCIATQTKAYLAANTEEFFFLIYYIYGWPIRIDLVTEDADYNINTIQNSENQRETLFATAKKYVSVEPARYREWIGKVAEAIGELDSE